MKKKLLLSPKVYSEEAAKLAAFIFSDRFDVRLSRSGGRLRAELEAPDAEKAAGEFLNETLNQQCRIDLARSNSRIAEIIVTRALLSAAGETGAGQK